MRAQRGSPPELPLPHGVADNEHGFSSDSGFDEVECAHLDRPHGRLDVAVPGDHHDRSVNTTLAKPRERREPVDARSQISSTMTSDGARDTRRGLTAVRRHILRRAAHRSALRTPASSTTRTVDFIRCDRVQFPVPSWQLPVMKYTPCGTGTWQLETSRVTQAIQP